LTTKSWLANQSLIGDTKWLRLARIVGYIVNEQMAWNTAETAVYKYITGQLESCRKRSFTAIYVDIAGIGKTHTCKEYAEHNPNTYYIDCSDAPTKRRFVRTFAEAVGIVQEGTYDDMIADAIYGLQNTDRPLIILDEAGDLDDGSIQTLKRIYNQLEDICGFYLIGADGLKARLERGIRCKKVGFTEVFSRFGKKFSRRTPAKMDEQAELLKEMAADVLRANGIRDETQIEEIQAQLFTEGTVRDLRTVKREVIKIRMAHDNKTTK